MVLVGESRKVVAWPPVGAHHRAPGNALAYKRTQRGPVGIGDHTQTHSSGVFASRFRLANLDGADHQGLVFCPTSHLRSFASSSPDERLVDLDLAVQRLALGVQHRRTQLVQHLERGLVAAQAKLALQLDRRNARRECGDQERRIEPVEQRLLRPMHDGPCGQRRLLPTLTAKHRVSGVVEDELRTTATEVAAPPLRPTQREQVAHTGRLVGEQTLKLGQ